MILLLICEGARRRELTALLLFLLLLLPLLSLLLSSALIFRGIRGRRFVFPLDSGGGSGAAAVFFKHVARQRGLLAERRLAQRALKSDTGVDFPVAS